MHLPVIIALMHTLHVCSWCSCWCCRWRALGCIGLHRPQYMCTAAACTRPQRAGTFKSSTNAHSSALQCFSGPGGCEWGSCQPATAPAACGHCKLPNRPSLHAHHAGWQQSQKNCCCTARRRPVLVRLSTARPQPALTAARQRGLSAAARVNLQLWRVQGVSS